MKSENFNLNATRTVLAAAIALALAGCGSSSGTSQGSSPVVSQGTVTAIGSIWVNGVEYSGRDDGQTEVNGIPVADDSAMTGLVQEGMRVRLRGRRNDDGLTGTVDSVEFEAEVEGILDHTGDDNVYTVRGRRVYADDDTRYIGGTSLSLDGQNVEVYGHQNPDGSIHATLVRLDSDDTGDDEFKGIVSAIDRTANTITVGGIALTYDDGTTVFVDGATPITDAGINVGDFVEVHLAAGSSTFATRIELEDDANDLAEGEEVEFESVITAMSGDAGFDTQCPTVADGFAMRDVCVELPGSEQYFDGVKGDLALNVLVEVEGHMVGGELVAEKVKFRGNRVRANAAVTEVGAGTFKIFSDATATGITVRIESGLTRNEHGTVSVSDGIELRGFKVGASTMIATNIKTQGLSGGRSELRGPIVYAGGGATNFTILGVNVAPGPLANLELEIGDTVLCDDDSGPVCNSGHVTTFFSGRLTNDVLDVRGTFNGAGTIDTIEADKLEVEFPDD